MAQDRLPGKLAVILHADIVGSTLLVQQDEQLAHQRIREAFTRFGDCVRKYHGRVQELRGDALLAEFERASDALSAALAFQSEHQHYLETLADDIQPHVRVGIALGEVIIADHTVTGVGVVLAQRIEQLAHADGVCITSAIHEALPGRMPFAFESLGEQTLKGFDEPVRVYRAQLVEGEAMPLPQQPGHVTVIPGKRWKMFAMVLLAVLAIAIGYRYFEPREDPASLERMAFPLPEKPSIAVLPFTSMTSDTEQEYFADGMSEDLITDLSKISGLFVIARNSSFSYKGQQVKVRRVAEELGVRYVLEGSVRRVGEQIRINAQLIDATTGGHLWAERYDGTLADVFALQDRVTTNIVEALSVTLTPREQESLGSIDTSSIEAHDAYLQGLSFYLRDTPADNASAEGYLLRATEIDPAFKQAYALLAKVYFKGAEPEYSRALGHYWRKSIFYAYRNLARSEGAGIADVHVVRSQMALYKHQVGVALDEAGQALEISANDADALKARAAAMIYSGEYQAGREIANRVKRIDPVAIAEPLYLIGLSHFAEGSYRVAAEYLEQALENDPETSAYTRLLAATYGKLGFQDQASEAWLRYRKKWHWPVWIAAEVVYYPFEDNRVLEHLAEGYKVAGVAERPPVRFLQLGRDARLSGAEIEALLFGHTIKGSDFWDGTGWQQTRDASGRVTQTGTSFHTGNIAVDEGAGWTEGDRLCEQWVDEEGETAICILIFRDTARGPGHYLLVNDFGPQPFQVVD